jgi:hypothetical protein
MWGDSIGWDGEGDPSPYYQGVFRGCDKLTSITFPDSLRYLGTQVFYQSNIQHVYLGESFMGFVSDYDTWAYDDLSEFNQWVFSKEENQNYKTSTKLNTISEFAQGFIADVSLKSIRVSSKNKYFSSKNGVLYNKSMDTLLYYPRCKKGSSYTLPDSVTKLDKFCLTGNKYLKKIISKNKVTIRQPSAFLGSAKKQPTLDHEITVVQKKS